MSIEHLPWSHTCFVCGQDNPNGFRLRIREENGRVMLDHSVRMEDSGWKGVMHGGLTMTLLDEVMTWAAIRAIGRGCVSAEFTTRLKQPIRVGERIRVEGCVTENRRRMARVEGRVLSAAGETLAEAVGKYMPVGDETAGAFEKDFVRQ